MENKYLIRRKVLQLFGASFHIFDSNGRLCFFVSQKAFKLKEDIRVFSDETKSEELLLIKARNVIDFSAVYDVFDSKTGERLGAFKRKGMKSIFKDEWLIIDTQENQVGIIKEDSALMATLRRFLTNLIPQNFDGYVGQNKVFEFHHKFNPFVTKIELDFSVDTRNTFDRRLGIAAGVLLCSIEGKQN